MLSLDRIRFEWPGRDFVFTMQARPGEITAISGPSGAGKSTLLDIIAGFVEPADGTLTLDGMNLLPLPPERRPVSILFQSDTLFEHLSASRNVELGLPPRTSDASARVARALHEIGLPDVGPQRAATLSGGEKQRVALARTLLRDRPVLLLDEPFSALDDATRGTIRDLVRTLTIKQGWHTVLVSHHADDISALADRRYVIDAGVLVEA